MSKNVNKMIKLAESYSDKYNIEKKAALPAAAAGVAKAIAWIIGFAVANTTTEKINDWMSLKDGLIGNIDNILKSLSDYEKSYTFGVYDREFKNFISICNNLKNQYNTFTTEANQSTLKEFQSLKSKPENERVEYISKGNFTENLHKFEKIELDMSNILNSMQEFSGLSPSISEYLDKMRNVGGQALDMIRSINLDFGLIKAIGTDTINIKESILALNKIFLTQRPRLELDLKEIQKFLSLWKEKIEQVKSTSEPTEEYEPEEAPESELEFETPKKDKVSQLEEIANAGSALFS